MSDRGLQFRFGVSLVLALVCGSAAPASGPLFPGAQYGAGEGPKSVAVGHLNGDDWLDLAVANRGSDNVSVLLGNGDGTFAPVLHFGVHNGADSIAIGDLNGDERLDLATASFWDFSVSVLLNHGECLPGDVDGDCDVDLADLAPLLGAYGACAGDANYDPNGDFDANGCVDLWDLLRLLSNYGAGA